MPLYDLLAERRAEDDALCAVCGGGDSDKTAENEIVFCERCDVAVHQKCYAIDVIPAGGFLGCSDLGCLVSTPQAFNLYQAYLLSILNEQDT